MNLRVEQRPQFGLVSENGVYMETPIAEKDVVVCHCCALWEQIHKSSNGATEALQKMLDEALKKGGQIFVRAVDPEVLMKAAEYCPCEACHSADIAARTLESREMALRPQPSCLAAQCS